MAICRPGHGPSPGTSHTGTLLSESSLWNQRNDCALSPQSVLLFLQSRRMNTLIMILTIIVSCCYWGRWGEGSTGFPVHGFCNFLRICNDYRSSLKFLFFKAEIKNRKDSEELSGRVWLNPYRMGSLHGWPWAQKGTVCVEASTQDSAGRGLWLALSLSSRTALVDTLSVC